MGRRPDRRAEQRPEAGVGPSDGRPLSPPDALFDLAINRAATTLGGLGLSDVASPQAQAALAEWHARTRFALRVPLAEVTRCLALRESRHGAQHWAGGPHGGWHPGRAPFP